jgi:hypothetical protein
MSILFLTYVLTNHSFNIQCFPLRGDDKKTWQKPKLTFNRSAMREVSKRTKSKSLSSPSLNLTSERSIWRISDIPDESLPFAFSLKPQSSFNSTAFSRAATKTQKFINHSWLVHDWLKFNLFVKFVKLMSRTWLRLDLAR